MNKAEEMPMDSRGIKILSHSTIRSWMEAVVELVTNSDDAYKRLENTKTISSGEIKISIAREKGGNWNCLYVLDEAGGIDREKLNSVTTFFADANEYKKNKNIRGFFGRGLKETIVTLGIGEIITIKNSKLNIVKIWYDHEKRKAYRQFTVENKEVTKSIRQEYNIKNEGTLIKIEVKNTEIKVPELEKVIEQLTNHLCLRDILLSKNRKLILEFDDIKRRSKSIRDLKFQKIDGKEILNKKINIPGFPGKISLIIYESKNQLNFKKYSPFNKAGILIKTNSAILDNQLFKFENDPIAYYFYGEAISEEIEKILRSEESSILLMGRSGIDWTNDYAQLLMKTIERELEPIIERKKKELSQNKVIELNDNNKRLFKELSKLFNQIYEEELDEEDLTITAEDNFEEEAFIRPKSPNLPPRKPRVLCLYANEKIIKLEGEQAIINSKKNKIYILDPKIYLERHSKYPGMFLGRFRVEGINLGDEDIIEAKIGKQIILCDVRVKEMGHLGNNHSNPKKGGISGFEPNTDPNPMQRAYYNKKTGKIEIFIQFPGVSKYLGESLENTSTDKGKMLLCEIVCEAFFNKIAEDSIKNGKEVPFGGDSIESHIALYGQKVYDLQKKYLNQVYSLVMNWNSEIIDLDLSTQSKEELKNNKLGEEKVLEEEYECSFCGELFDNHSNYNSHIKKCSKDYRVNKD